MSLIMNSTIKTYFFLFFLFTSCFVFSQTDTTQVRGTIKIAKAKNGEVYVKAVCKFNMYNVAGGKGPWESVDKYQPFPVVQGYAYPFNYNKYFNDCFSKKVIELKGKEKDTVVMEVKILENGKVYIKDKSPSIMVKGVPATYDNKTGTYELNNLHLNCLKFLKQIDKWIPGYIILPKKDKFRGQVVIKPNKKNVDVTGTVTVFFSYTPFEE
jgi:hypothetical protein